MVLLPQSPKHRMVLSQPSTKTPVGSPRLLLTEKCPLVAQMAATAAVRWFLAMAGPPHRYCKGIFMPQHSKLPSHFHTAHDSSFVGLLYMLFSPPGSLLPYSSPGPIQLSGLTLLPLPWYPLLEHFLPYHFVLNDLWVCLPFSQCSHRLSINCAVSGTQTW